MGQESTMGAARLLLMSVLGLATFAACGGATRPGPSPLVLERTIPLKDVKGRIDHLAIDLAHGRLFVAELGNGTVEAIDLRAGQSVGRIGDLKEPQGLAYLPGRDELAVASGGDGTVRFYRAADLTPLGVLKVGDDADNMRVDPRSGRLIVGYGGGALATIDQATRKIVSILPLPGHPESFRLDGSRVLINVPEAGVIEVGDLDAGRITATWKGAHALNFPLAVDPTSGVLATVYRLPSRLAVLDAASGAIRADLATCGDADDVFFDAKRQQIYVTCGSGAVDVVQTRPTYVSIARIATRPGARTSLFVPELDRLFVAARASGSTEAAVLVYRPQP
jgi:DNA-binding beta-propeller fold protein YncE